MAAKCLQLTQPLAAYLEAARLCKWAVQNGQQGLVADVWPVECRVLVVPQQEGPVVIAVQQSVFLQATQGKAQRSCICADGFSQP